MPINKITKSPTPIELVNKVNELTDLANIAKGVYVSATAPVDTSILWLNTTTGQNTLNYYNGTTWIPITGVYV